MAAPPKIPPAYRIHRAEVEGITRLVGEAPNLPVAVDLAGAWFVARTNAMPDQSYCVVIIDETDVIVAWVGEWPWD